MVSAIQPFPYLRPFALLDHFDHTKASSRFRNARDRNTRHDRHLATSHLSAHGKHSDLDLVSSRDVGQDPQRTQRRQPRPILDRIRCPS